MKEKQRDFLKLCLADALLKLMEEQDFSEISVNAICKTADIGRTTFYRYFGGRNSKEEVLIFKITYEWEIYRQKHEDEVKRDQGYAMSCYVYENRKVFSLIYRHHLTGVLLDAFARLTTQGEMVGREQSYLQSFFVCGYFGIMYQWIRYGFDETPEQVQRHIAETFASAVSRAQDAHSASGERTSK
ncbi:MAG: TetR/AcrR family transcriptional regulator [Eubacterium sp.]|nr:TetR/AcrR family transcriptional regulator [Eubacterium sp.]